MSNKRLIRQKISLASWQIGKLVRIFAPRTYKNHYGRNKI
ncbi:hypothetical protein HMPREF9074_07744 [Capnocytophaga sp. oral taxon 329 str. F0087]|nr:hypothetical protein HMPREF9074_07744 [Capnocytophaga sp. oral taxon 329 str. F0087]